MNNESNNLNINIETEPYGVEYERFALQKLFDRLAGRYDIKTVLELPATGAKAMPSIYSLGWALAGCHVTLVNGDRKVSSVWERLGLREQIEFITVNDIVETGLPDKTYDLVWNFNVLPGKSQWERFLDEMARLSNKYLMFIHVNSYNVGFPFHRWAHRRTGIPWSHGDVRFNSPGKFKRILQERGYPIKEIGVVDCPCWPDSLGFRDIRLHRQVDNTKEVEWRSHYLEWVETGGFPVWLKMVYLLEKLPIPLLLKYIYAHLFYVIVDSAREI